MYSVFQFNITYDIVRSEMQKNSKAANVVSDCFLPGGHSDESICHPHIHNVFLVHRFVCGSSSAFLARTVGRLLRGARRAGGSGESRRCAKVEM